jgi:cyanophycinase
MQSAASSNKVSGSILLEGGAEFGGRMAEPDLRALALSGGFDAPVCILPTAAAPDHNHERAGRNGVRWFTHLGARRVRLLPLIDRASADNESIAAAIRDSRLIYLLGGFPQYLGETLAGSLSAQAMLYAYQAGAVIAGSSAGAMVLCQHYYSPETGGILAGLNWVPHACLIPHHDTFGKGWVPELRRLLREDILIGVDEQTGMIRDGADGSWTVHGKGQVGLYRGENTRVYQQGEEFSLPGVS